MLHPYAKLVKTEAIHIGDNSQIDDFVFIYGGRGMTIGRCVHIASFVSIIGDGELEIGDYSALACGARIITGTNIHQGGHHMSHRSPKETQKLWIGKIVMGKDVFIGANSVVMPDVTIGDGVVVGANSLVNKNLEPWGIYVGNPCQRIKDREPVRFR